MKILVTGNEGMIGTCLVKHLRSIGHTVRLFREEGSWRDINEPADVRNAMAGVDAVVHLAAVLNYSAMGNYMVNVYGTEHVLAAAIKEGVKGIVFTSTQGVYGTVGYEGTPLREDQAARPSDINLEYSISKWDAEEKCRAVANKIKCCILRLAGVYGPVMEPDNLVRGLLDEAMTGTIRVFGHGQRPCDLVHIDDVVATITNALGRSGTYNVGSGVLLTVGAVAAMVADLTGAKIEYLTDRQEKNGIVMDSTRAQAELGHCSRSLREGLIDIIQRDEG